LPDSGGVQSGFDRRRLEPTLRRGVDRLQLELDNQQIDRLLAYLDLLQHWNRSYNLTAVDEPERMLTVHLLDSLGVAAFLTGKRVLDVGTGAGLPGVPLAILFPDRQFTLLDSNGKKTRFLFQVRRELGLDNLQEIQIRAESYRPEKLFDAVISRAFANLGELVRLSGHLLRPGGRLYAMKGHYPADELRDLPKPYKVHASHRVEIPGLEGERHLLVISQ